MAMIEQMTPEEEARLRLAASISPSTPTEYMLRHIPLWVKMSILRRNLGAGAGFNPISLFKEGREGAWYDPSDLSTLFQDAEGTIPVTSHGDPVGLMLDKRLGPELVTNGMFDTNISGWIESPQFPKTSAVEWVNGALHVFNPQGDYSESRSPAIPLTIGKRYVLEMDILDGTTANYWIIIGSSPATDRLGRIAVTGETDGTSPSGYKRWRYSFVASYATAYLYFATNKAAGSHIYADNISVRELHGNHAAQAVAAARPIYRTDGTLHWLEFDGVDDHLKVPDNPSLRQAVMDFGVAVMSREARRQDFISCGNTLTHDTNNWLIQVHGSHINLIPRFPSIILSLGVFSVGVPFVVSASSNGSNVSGRVNMGEDYTSTCFLGTDNEMGLVIGASNRSSITHHLNGRIYGIILTGQSNLAPNLRRDVDKYLAAKSGVTL